MTAIVAGQYKQGRIELLETPAGLREGPVRVVLIEEPAAKASPRFLTLGKYKAGVMSSLEDFEGTQWRGEAELDNQHGQ